MPNQNQNQSETVFQRLDRHFAGKNVSVVAITLQVSDDDTGAGGLVTMDDGAIAVLTSKKK